jgi:hypothetical protein
LIVEEAVLAVELKNIGCNKQRAQDFDVFGEGCKDATTLCVFHIRLKTLL